MADDRYNVNFFKPKSDHARFNMKMIAVMVLIWSVAVFGFQFLLVIMEKPVAEPPLHAFKKVWTQVETGAATEAENQEFARSVLMVLGKNVVVKPPHKALLSDALNTTLRALSTTPAAIDAERAAELIGLRGEGFDILLRDMLPTYVKSVEGAAISAEVKKDLPRVMDLYLIHNRSVLTDTKFLGFPFHYWYTAQFLLILFVLLCLVYAKITDAANEKFNFEEEE